MRSCLDWRKTSQSWKQKRRNWLQEYYVKIWKSGKGGSGWLGEEGKEDKDSETPERWFRVRIWIDQNDEEFSGKPGDDLEGDLKLEYNKWLRFLELSFWLILGAPAVSDAGWVSRYDIFISSAGEEGTATSSTSNTKAAQDNKYGYGQ